ncbi:hypothetical protein CBR_g48609 [Chara braunii]|uniref:DDE Tnp4 domain-containing protein n=1 Tax=Chara braunii TaxID=69332 RepID=A0A388M3E9_CHABU|nr:hypothetical protein CBR_g48609 [Chara braunii]|eukprot:GBG88999.1 hypothetical protein CBR_g48609 [Chara braunii]
MTAAVKLAVTPSSEAIAMTGPVGRPHQAQRPSPAQLECNHACARIAASLSSIVGGRREGGGPRKRRLDHPSSAAGGTRCTAVMARFLGGGDRSIRAPLVAGRRAPAAIAPRNFSSTLALTAFGGRRTSRKTLRSFPSLSECYGRKGSEADLEREALAAGCSQSCRCSRITSASPQRQMLQWSRRRSLSHGCRLGRMAIGRGRSAGERRLVAVAFKQSPEGEGENQHEQGGKSPPAPPSMFSVKQLLLGAGKGGEAQLMAASSGDAGERSVDVGLGPGADRLMQQVMEAPDCMSFSESIVQFCCAMASGAIPPAIPRWWMRRRTGGAWEDLWKMDDAAEVYYKENLQMSPRVFRENSRGVVPSSAAEVEDVTRALVRVYREKTVWHSGLRTLQWLVVLRAFEVKGFPNCYGCIDCMHIYVDKPATALSEKFENYFDRKHRFSVVVQVVVSLDLCVTGVFVGYPGSWHDIQVIQLSSLWTRAEEGDLFHGPAVLPLFGV